MTGLEVSVLVVVVFTVLLLVAVVGLIVLWKRLLGYQQLGDDVNRESVVEQNGVEPNAMFATLSHELRTPLNGLLGIAQMLNEKHENDKDLQAVEGCARHMLAVITTLVNHSKIQEGIGDLPKYREWVSLYDVLEQLKHNLGFRADLRGLKIELDHQDKRLRLRTDGDHLRTILENAILGSIEAVSLVASGVASVPQSEHWQDHGRG